MKSLSSACWFAMLLAACSAAPEGELGAGRSALISDGAHAGRDGFYFLPPLLPQPGHHGAFDPTLAPSVKIRELASNTVVTEFASSAIAVDSAAQHYAVNWDTRSANLDPAKIYRISVLLHDYEVGYADVDPASNGRELQNVNTGEYIPLLDGRTLPIKFRLEKGVIDDLIPSVALGLTPFAQGKTAGSGTASFSVIGNFPSIFYVCRLNGADVPCVSPLPWTGLEDGSTLTVEVTATSTTTGIQGPTARATAVVDASPPTIENVSPIPGSTNARQVLLSFTSSDTVADATFTCSINGAFIPCEPDAPTLVDLLNGPNEFTITSVDLVGNSNTHVDFFNVDAMGPVFDASHTRVPATSACSTSSDDTEIRFQAEESSSPPVTYTCALDGNTAKACGESPLSNVFRWSDLTNGVHTVQVVAYDVFRNASQPLDIYFIVDREAPAAEIDIPATTTREGAFVVTLTEQDPSAYSHVPMELTECVVTDAAGAHDCVATCTRSTNVDASPALFFCEFVGLTPGAASVRVTARDACGATNSVIASTSWIVE